MRHSAILDIGSSKVICMVVSAESDGAIAVHGLSAVPYSGYRLGELPDKRALAAAVGKALKSAADEARLRIREVCVGVSAPFMRVVTREGRAAVASRDGRISSADVEALLENSLEGAEPEGYSLIHSTPVNYVVDGTSIVGSPIALPASELTAVVSHCYVDNAYKAIVTGILLSLGVEADMFISSALATAYFAIDEDIRAESAVLIDCGGTHTDVSLIGGNALVGCESIGMGGEHFTSDLCYGLRLPAATADDIKKRYTFGLDYGDTSELVRIPGEGVFEIEHSLVQLIIESRAEELCEMIRAACDRLHAGSSPVWLMGGGLALMRGADEFLEGQLGRKVNITMPYMSRHSTVGYAAAFGLADFALFRCGRTSALKNTGRRLLRSLDRHF